MSILAEHAPGLVPPASSGSAGLLQRGRLDLPVTRDGRSQLIEVVAPAGYGKTTLLRSWQEEAARSGWRTLWVALDEALRVPRTLVRRILAALNGSAPSQITFDTEAAGLDQLLSQLDRLEEPCILFLDDVQILSGTPAFDTLTWLLANQPPSLVIVLASREQSPLPLQTRRLRGELKRYSARDLAFTSAECARFFEETHGISLTQDQIAHLYRRTEGWAAAVQLAALALAETEDRAAFISEFGGSNRDLTDYLTEAVLQRLEPADRAFLLRISVLDRLCADLCTAVTGVTDAQRRLESFERRSLFLVALDDRREWYRLHALFRGFLRARAAAEDVEHVRRDIESAARWCMQHDLREDAIDYALQAGLVDYAASLISEHAQQLVKIRGEHERLVEWIRRLPADVLARYPAIQLNHAWSLTFQSRFVEADAALDAISRSMEAADLPSPAQLDVQRARELNRCMMAALTDHVAPSIAMSRDWLASWPDASGLERGQVLAILAYGYKCTGDFAAVGSAVEEGRRCFAGTPYGLAWIEFFNVLTLMRQGRYSAARSACSAAMSMAVERLGRSSLMYCMQAALQAAIELEINNLAAAREALAHGLKFLEPYGCVDSILVAYVTLARLMAAEGRFVDACDLLQEGEATGRRRDTPRLTISLVAERALLLLRNGQLETVAELLRTELRAPAAEGEFAGVLRDKRLRIEARLALARGAAAEALETVGGLLHHVRQTQQVRKHVELLLIRAVAQQALGRSNDALRSLAEALRLAAPERLTRVFLDEGERLHPLIAALKGSEKPSDAGADDESMQKLLEQLAATIRSGGSRAVVTQAESGVLDPLTPRELQILRMMESGLSAKQLARALFVTEGTVKWHLYNMYGKLDVRNRSAAIAKARRTGLL